MLYAVVGCLILWLVGFGFGIGGSLVHVLLLAALVGVIVTSINRRRRAA